MKQQYTIDFDGWMATNGPCDLLEANQLDSVIDCPRRAGPYTSERGKNGGLFIRRGKGTILRLSAPSVKTGFKKFVWYYRSGYRPWNKPQASETLERFFDG